MSLVVLFGIQVDNQTKSRRTNYLFFLTWQIFMRTSPSQRVLCKNMSLIPLFLGGSLYSQLYSRYAEKYTFFTKVIILIQQISGFLNFSWIRMRTSMEESGVLVREKYNNFPRNNTGNCK